LNHPESFFVDPFPRTYGSKFNLFRFFDPVDDSERTDSKTSQPRKFIPLMMRGKEGKYLAYGKTHGGRLLFIVWASKYKKTKIITARDMTGKEKRFHRRRKG
jgi:uncharacterized DUF497 family protein